MSIAKVTDYCQQSFIVLLKDSSAACRLKGLSNLIQMVDDLRGNDQLTKLEELFNTSTSLVLCDILTDESERNRELCIKLLISFSEALQQHNINLKFLNKLIDTIWNRLSCPTSVNNIFYFKEHRASSLENINTHAPNNTNNSTSTKNAAGGNESKQQVSETTDSNNSQIDQSTLRVAPRTTATNRINLDIVSISDADTCTSAPSQTLQNCENSKKSIKILASSSNSQVLTKHQQDTSFMMRSADVPGEHKRESSEEIKKLVMQLLSSLLGTNSKLFETWTRDQAKKSKQKQKSFLQFLNILFEFMMDPCPALRKDSCKLLITVLSAVQRFKCLDGVIIEYSLYLAEALAQGLLHQRAKLRLISLQALSSLILFCLKCKSLWPAWLNMGATASVNGNIWNSLLLLRYDRIAYMRTQLIVACVEWLATLHEFSIKQEASLWYLILSGVTDASPQVVQKCEQSLQCYQAVRLKKLASDSGTIGKNEDVVKSTVRACIKDILALVRADIEHWQHGNRIYAMRILETLISYISDAVTTGARESADETNEQIEQVCELIPLFANFIDYEANTGIMNQSQLTLINLGRHASIQRYIGLFEKQFDAQTCQSMPHGVAQYLKVLKYLLKGAENQLDLEENVLHLLSQPQLCQHSSLDMTLNVLQCFEAILQSNAMTNKILQMQNLSKKSNVCSILWAVVQVHASYLKYEQPWAKILQIPKQHQLFLKISEIETIIAAISTDVTVETLWEPHFETLLHTLWPKMSMIDDSECKDTESETLDTNEPERKALSKVDSILWDTTSIEYFAFVALMYYGSHLVPMHLGQIVPMLEKGCNIEVDAKVRSGVLSTILRMLEHTKWNTKTNEYWSQYAQVLILQILIPNCVWKVGRANASARHLALQCLLTVYQNCMACVEITRKYWEKIIPTIESMMDEFDTNIRVLSVTTMKSILLNLRKERVIFDRETAFRLSRSLLPRLDDSSDTTRMIACETIASLTHCIDFEKDSKRLSEIVETMLVHLDDNSQEIQMSVYDALIEISQHDAHQVIDIVQKNKHNHSDVEMCDKLIQRVESSNPTLQNNPDSA